jgi:hypothetical protein
MEIYFRYLGKAYNKLDLQNIERQKMKVGKAEAQA